MSDTKDTKKGPDRAMVDKLNATTKKLRLAGGEPTSRYSLSRPFGNATAKYLQQMNIQQAPSVSYLDEVLAALSARRDELPVAKLPQSFIDSLSSDDI